MARARMVKPEFYSDPKMKKLKKASRLFFIGLLNFSEDSGIIENEHDRLKILIFPYDDDTTEDIQGYITELQKANLIWLYSNKNKNYIYIINFEKHQYIQKKSKCFNPKPTHELSIPDTNNYDNSIIPVSYYYHNSISEKKENRKRKEFNINNINTSVKERTSEGGVTKNAPLLSKNQKLSVPKQPENPPPIQVQQPNSLFAPNKKSPAARFMNHFDTELEQWGQVYLDYYNDFYADNCNGNGVNVKQKKGFSYSERDNLDSIRDKEEHDLTGFKAGLQHLFTVEMKKPKEAKPWWARDGTVEIWDIDKHWSDVKNRAAGKVDSESEKGFNALQEIKARGII